MATPTTPKRSDDQPKSFAKGLFAGRIHEDFVFPYPQISEEEGDVLKLVLENIRKFSADKIDSAKIDAEGEIPSDVLDGFREMGLFGLGKSHCIIQTYIHASRLLEKEFTRT